MKLNEKILYCRKKKGLSQEGLAEELGVSRQAVSKWETGDAVPEIGKLVSLAKTFEVTTDWLLSEEEPEDKQSESESDVEENTSAFGQNNSFDGYYKESSTWGSYTGSSYGGNSFQETNATGFQSTSDTLSGAERFEKAADDWMDRVPGVLGKLVRRFGWIAGAYIAAGGAGLTMIGLIARTMVNSMVNGFQKATNDMFSGFGGFGGSSVTFYDANGNQMSARESAQLAKALGNSGAFDDFSGFGGNSIVDSGMSAMNGMLANNPVSIFANFMIIAGLIMLIAGTVFAVVWYKKSKEQ